MNWVDTYGDMRGMQGFSLGCLVGAAAVLGPYLAGLHPVAGFVPLLVLGLPAAAYSVHLNEAWYEKARDE